ncbi:MAG: flagellar biosynthesis protein FlhA [Deltaproteobacteria bacterium]|nr:flagellar biosynthesis protein FlhA [Deltaproteobacteria bacterium]
MALSLPSKSNIPSISIPVALVATISILMLPISPEILDIGLALNFTISLIILFVSLFIAKLNDFTSFPAVLLMTTLYRLALNVAATRLILLHGNEGLDAAGSVIRAFGEFVVGGNYVVGCVIFITINIVNLKVITKGATRIAEVAARFTLDAMPGKQMAIDSDLNTGLIGEDEARRRRKELSQEAEFYGSMDGAAKFVSGDAVAGLFITGINIVGGLFMGIVLQGMDWRIAAQTYTLLTIGDGLVSQIPSIVISTSAGLIVARAASSGADMGTEVFSQLFDSEKPLLIASAACLGLAIVPGLPTIPFLVLAAASGGIGFSRQKTKKREAEQIKLKELKSGPADSKAVKPGSTEEVTGLLGVDTLELEVGYELVALVEAGDLVERIRSLRRQFALDYGFIVPAIHIRDNVRLRPSEYHFVLKGSTIGSGELKGHHLLAMDPGNVTAPIDGIATKEPAFGLDALWIRESEKERAQFAGYTVVDLATVITTHITELVRSNMAELIGRSEVQHLVDHLAKEHPKVVEELIPNLLTLGQVQQVLANLLREQVSIRDLRTIFETLADWAGTVKSPERLAEFVRRKLSRLITAKFTGDEGVLPLVSLNPALERMLGEALQQTDEGSFLGLEPGLAQQLINKLNRLADKFVERGQTPVLLAPTHLRAALFHFVAKFVPGYAVMSHQEIAPNTKVQSLGVVAIEDNRTAAIAANSGS